MNSLKKIEASGLVVGAVVTIIRTTVLSSFKDYTNNSEHFSMAKWLGSVFVGGFLSACGGVTTVIDKYVNQNITNNKVAQYGLTALEGLLVAPTVSFICGDRTAYTKYFDGLFNTGDWKQEHSDGWEQHAITKIMTSSIILLALTFKCIWDSEENTTDDITTPELDLVKMDEDSINTAFDSVDQTADISIELNKWSFTSYFRNLFSNTTDSISIDEVDISVEPSILSSINTICNDMSIQLMDLSTRLKSYIWDSENSTINDITNPELDLVEMDSL